MFIKEGEEEKEAVAYSLAAHSSDLLYLHLLPVCQHKGFALARLQIAIVIAIENKERNRKPSLAFTEKLAFLFL